MKSNCILNAILVSSVILAFHYDLTEARIGTITVEKNEKQGEVINRRSLKKDSKTPKKLKKKGKNEKDEGDEDDVSVLSPIVLNVGIASQQQGTIFFPFYSQ